MDWPLLIVVTLFILFWVFVLRKSLRREKRTGQVAPQEIYISKHLEQSPSSGKQWGQGRLAHEQISTSANIPTTDSQGGFHYVHEFIRASTVTEEKEMMGLGVPQEIATPYASDEVEAHLNAAADLRHQTGIRAVAPRLYCPQRHGRRLGYQCAD